MEYYNNITRCRICYSTDLTEVVKIKGQFIASTFVKSNVDNPKAKIRIPMTVMLCGKCGLVQIKETLKQDLLYENYFYRSSVSDTMKRDLKDVVNDVCSRVELKPNDHILDIGSNDGWMLSQFPKNLKRIGIEPATNIDWSHLDKSIDIINEYFPSPKLDNYRFKIITSTAMFYDLDNPNTSLEQIKKILTKDGVLCIQVSYLYDTIKDMNFYDFCHEHLEYYSLKTLNFLMEKNSMSIFDASTNAVNGGSLRVMVSQKEANRPISKNVAYFILKEKALQLENTETYDAFSKQIKSNVDIINDYIKNQKGLVIGLGASTKGNVLLQLCGIDKKTIPYISERNPLKVGLRTLGTDILLISEQKARELKPACMFVIPWNFKNEILEREKEYIAQGGKMLFIMPYPYVIDKNGETKL